MRKLVRGCLTASILLLDVWAMWRVYDALIPIGINIVFVGEFAIGLFSFLFLAMLNMKWPETLEA
jgi:hypothetical protein